MEYIIIAALFFAAVLLSAVIAGAAARKTSGKIDMLNAKIEQFTLLNQSSDKLLREELSGSLEMNRRSISDAMDSGLRSISSTVGEKLELIRGTVDEKMTKSLNERLDSNFRQIGEHLSELYKSLGELNRLSGGVQDLNRTLSNVKTRGVWGEQQLGAILSDIMTPSQYEKNAITKRGSQDRVEFAIKLPSGTDSGGFTYLPIDSKLPSDIYRKIYTSAENCDADSLSAAVKELEQRIKAEAKAISSKYIDPPATTDFAIMFLPTEGLFAEVLRIDGLSEWCQTNERIMIAGPTTIAALLNSLRVGFANVALNEKSVEVMRLLMAVKSQYQKFGEQIDGVRARLSSALRSADELKHRSEIIQRRMQSIDAIDGGDADRLLGLGGEIYEDNE